jgi:hypothetical protein
MLQGRLVKVAGQLVPLGKNRANWMVAGGFEVVAVGEGVRVGEMFLGYFAVPLTWMVWVCWAIWAITSGTAMATISTMAKTKSFFLTHFTSERCRFILGFHLRLDN